MIEKILVIGDPHVEEGQELYRFDALGNFILENQPEYIVCIGDFLSIDALSKWDLNKRALLENRRFKNELVAGEDAMSRIEYPLLEHNSRRQNIKKKQYQPKKIFIEGNHERRWFIYGESNPQLIDLVDIYDEIGLNKYGWQLVPYRHYAYINGIGFTHVPMDGSNNPMRGMRYMQTAARDHVNSVVFGHTHRLAFETYARHGEEDRQTLALNVGWYGHNIPNYAKGSQGSKNWWSGLVMLNSYGNGRFDYQTYSLNYILRNYL